MFEDGCDRQLRTEKSDVKNRFLLLYASQTGQAKAIAEEIADAAPNFGLQCDLRNLSLTEKKFKIELEKCVVFVVSTTGDGEPPDDAIKFFRRLSRRTLNSDYLKNVNYALLGLGDSNYIKFCNFGYQLEKRLISLSAKSFYPTGYGDDAFGIETAVDPWIASLWPALRKQLGIEDSIINNSHLRDNTGGLNYPDTMTKVGEHSSSILQQSCDIECLTIASLPLLLENMNLEKLRMPKVPDPILKLSFAEKNSLNADASYVPCESLLVSPASPPVKVSIVKAQKLTDSPDVKKTLELTLEFEGVKVDYEPGDSFGFICSNPEKEVTDLLERLKVVEVADVPCDINLHEASSTKRSLPKHIPASLCLREIFLSCIEIRAVPKKVLLRILSEYTENSNEKQCIQYLCSQEGSKHYTDFVRKPSLSILDILNLYKSCTPPVVKLLEYLPALRPRFYSVSSSSVNSNIFSVVFNVLEIPKSDGRYSNKEGICTGWLNRLSTNLQSPDVQHNELSHSLSLLSLEHNQIISVYKRKNEHFCFPRSLDVPIIMVGPGVGVSPFVGFLQHREKQMEAAGPDIKFGQTWLFYGCRYEAKDFLYKEELMRLKANKVLSHFMVSFSRDENFVTSRYVHESIRQHATEVSEVVKSGGSIYVCGDAKNMARDVLQAFMDVFQTSLNLSQEEAKNFVDNLHKQHRYLNDVWT